jgi:SAM-dependent methyltransferase
MATVDDVRKYWQEHPLLSYELAQPGSKEFFEAFDRVKREDVEAFAQHFWQFDQFRGQSVLDVGCGPGWLTVQYAQGGVNAYAIDLTPCAVSLTQSFLKLHGLSAVVTEGNAEQLPFADNFFDLVVASGVLHHTPDTSRAIRECYRVLKPGGHAKLTFYYKGMLHSTLVFPLTRLTMRLARVKHPGADLAKTATNPDDFIRQYDGALNPVGVGHTIADWTRLLREGGFVVERHEIHFFPRRFIPFQRMIPRFVHRLLDRTIGTMVYFDLRKT